MLLVAIIVAIISLLIGYMLAREKFIDEKTMALKGSRSATRGIIDEQISPLLPGFPGEASEARFIGKPIDFLVFNGMDQENINEVVFVEVKTGKYPRLNNNERTLKETIEAKRVRWEEYHISEEIK